MLSETKKGKGGKIYEKGTYDKEQEKLQKQAKQAERNCPPARTTAYLAFWPSGGFPDTQSYATLTECKQRATSHKKLREPSTRKSARKS